MKSIYTPITKIRRQVFAEIARLAYAGGDYSKLKSCPTASSPARCRPTATTCSWSGRSSANGCGWPAACPCAGRMSTARSPTASGRAPVRRTGFTSTPLVNVIPFACNACARPICTIVTSQLSRPVWRTRVSMCARSRRCHARARGKSHIDQGQMYPLRPLCMKACPYGRDCSHASGPAPAACGVDAIGSDHLGRANIDYDKCVSCGQCMVNCPFWRNCGQIADITADSRHSRSGEAGDRGDRALLCRPIRPAGHAGEGQTGAGASWALPESTRWPWARTSDQSLKRSTMCTRSPPARSRCSPPPAAPPGR